MEFKKLNDSLFLFVDKSPKLCYITKTDYDAKLRDLFENQNFEKITDFKLEKELVAFRQLLRETIGKSVSNIKLLNLNPINSISEAYDQIKLHKSGFPLPPLVPCHSSLTNKVEQYLKSILALLLKKCTFMVDSTQKFKEKFMVDNNKYDPEKNELLSFDINKLYPSVNVDRTLSFILEVIIPTRKNISLKNLILKVIFFRFRQE